PTGVGDQLHPTSCLWPCERGAFKITWTMRFTARWRKFLEPVLSIGSYPEEPETRRSGRRVFIVAFIMATLFSIPSAFSDLDAGFTWVAAMDFFTTLVVGPLALVAIWLRPRRFATLVNAMFVVIFVAQLAETAMV